MSSWDPTAIDNDFVALAVLLDIRIDCLTVLRTDAANRRAHGMFRGLRCLCQLCWCLFRAVHDKNVVDLFDDWCTAGHFAADAFATGADALALGAESTFLAAGADAAGFAGVAGATVVVAMVPIAITKPITRVMNDFIFNFLLSIDEEGNGSPLPLTTPLRCRIAGCKQPYA